MNYNLQQSSSSMLQVAAAPGANAPARAGQPSWERRRSPRLLVNREMALRAEERRRERTRIARDLHDTLFQGFVGVSLMLHSVVEEMPADSPNRASLSRTLGLMRRVIDEGRNTLRGLRSPRVTSTTLEQSLAVVGEELTADGRGFRLSVTGQPIALSPAVQEQIHLIAREALVNASRHAQASTIEAEIEYLHNKVRVVVRDNGSGIDEGKLRSAQDSHWGLLGMRERTSNIGAQLRIWSRRGAGTEVEISLPVKYVAQREQATSPAPAGPAVANLHLSTFQGQSSLSYDETHPDVVCAGG